MDAFSENTDQLNRGTFNLYIHPALHLTNLLPIDIQCSINVSHRFDGIELLRYLIEESKQNDISGPIFI